MTQLITPGTKERIISRTLLTLWPHLENYGKMLEQKVTRYTMSGFNSVIPTEQIMEKIIDVHAQRDTVRNLKKEIDTALTMLSPASRKMLINYFNGEDKRENRRVISQKRNLSERSFYRRLEAAIDELAKRLNIMGINSFTWSHLLITNDWLKRAYQQATLKMQPDQTELNRQAFPQHQQTQREY
jgi:hypothetical protein